MRRDLGSNLRKTLRYFYFITRCNKNICNKTLTLTRVCMRQRPTKISSCVWFCIQYKCASNKFFLHTTRQSYCFSDNLSYRYFPGSSSLFQAIVSSVLIYIKITLFEWKKETFHTRNQSILPHLFLQILRSSLDRQACLLTYTAAFPPYN